MITVCLWNCLPYLSEIIRCERLSIFFLYFSKKSINIYIYNHLTFLKCCFSGKRSFKILGRSSQDPQASQGWSISHFGFSQSFTGLVEQKKIVKIWSVWLNLNFSIWKLKCICVTKKWWVHALQSWNLL